ncbi:hypothetical protein [Streptomyces barringtoniae]|uniref:hypothetical protein n=1 Tax=Streptomyces barringtoniae TaxID=2892029 RepID=UPI001E2CAA2F|nr:hypothetical protein [Streptomyces barringtoniae]MCC5479176.1 hypothetical protein [Streptomyces barringtoniae]
MNVAASKADTGTCMAEGLSGSRREEAADGRVGRRQPGRITPARLIKVKAIRVRDQQVEGRGVG